MSLPLPNLFYMLIYAWNRLAEGEGIDVAPEMHDRVQNLLARMLVSSVAPLLRRGLARGYVAKSWEAPGVRGRILLGPTLRRQLIEQGRAVCESDELSVDRPINRILKAALTRLAFTEGVDPSLRAEVRGLLRWFQGIPDEPLHYRAFRGLQVYRADGRYRLPLAVAQLLARCSFPGAVPGRWEILDFRGSPQELGLLFQGFVYHFLKLEQSRYSVSAPQVQWRHTAGDEASLALWPVMQTDIVLSDHNTKLVVDTKYMDAIVTSRYGKSFNSSHLYQVFAYIRNIRRDDPGQQVAGMLLYPRRGEAVDALASVEALPIRVCTIDLEQPWQQVHSDLLALFAGSPVLPESVAAHH